MVKTVMHLFPRMTSKAECGIYGIMTNRIEDVTCPECQEHYMKHQGELIQEAKTKPTGVEESREVELNADDRVVNTNYSMGLADDSK